MALEGLADVISIEFTTLFVTVLDITKFATYGDEPPVTVALSVENWPALSTVLLNDNDTDANAGFIVKVLEYTVLTVVATVFESVSTTLTSSGELD